MKTSNTEQALWLGLGSLSSFLLTIISSVVLTRYFEINDYGTYKQVLYVYQTLLIIFTLGIPKAYSYFLPRTPLDQAKSVIRKIQNIFFALGSFFSVILFLASDIIADFLNNQNLGYALRLFSPVPFLMLPTMGLESLLAVYNKTQYAAIYAVTTRLLMLAFIVCPVVFFNVNYEVAIIGFVAASFVSFIIANYLKFNLVKNNVEKKSELSYKEILVYCLPLFTASIWGLIISSSDQFFISRYFGTEVFAIFANGSIDLPFVGMVVTASSTVMTPFFSKLVHENRDDLKDQIIKSWKSVLEKTIKILHPILFYFLFFSDYVILLLFGNDFFESSNFFRIKIIGNFFIIISYIGLIMAINANNYYSKVHLIHAFALIVFQYISIHLTNSPYGVVWVSVILRTLNTFLMLNYIAKYFGISLIKFLPLSITIKISLICLIILSLLKVFINNYIDLPLFYMILVSSSVYFIAYMFFSLLFKIDYKSIVYPILIKFKK